MIPIGFWSPVFTLYLKAGIRDFKAEWGCTQCFGIECMHGKRDVRGRSRNIWLTGGGGSKVWFRSDCWTFLWPAEKAETTTCFSTCERRSPLVRGHTALRTETNRSWRVHKQARTRTGFQRFTKIGQIFHNKYIFNKKKLSRLKSGKSSGKMLYPRRIELANIPSEWLRNPGKGTYRS